jgi:hypothetical protein
MGRRCGSGRSQRPAYTPDAAGSTRLAEVGDSAHKDSPGPAAGSLRGIEEPCSPNARVLLTIVDHRVLGENGEKTGRENGSA